MTDATVWLGAIRPVLASKSATRRLLLEQAGIAVDNEDPAVDERRLESEFIESGGEPSRLAGLLARAKALAVSARLPGRLCIGADQTLQLGGTLFHKPRDMDEARRTLARLAGHTHVLESAVCVAQAGAALFETTQVARLTMRALDEAAIGRYLAFAGRAALGSVGVYQVEGLGIHLFETIEGEHSTILGLPLPPLLKWLRANGRLAL